jgi:hypothetical protein
MNRRANATTGDYTGVTFYAPNINIGRDPRQYRRRRAETRSKFHRSSALTPGPGPSPPHNRQAGAVSRRSFPKTRS